MATKETKHSSQFGSSDSYYGSYGINFKHVMMYPGWRPAVENICSVKITKLGNMWEEIEIFIKIGKGPYLSLLL